MALLKKDTTALCLAVFVFMAMALSSCHAATRGSHLYMCLGTKDMHTVASFFYIYLHFAVIQLSTFLWVLMYCPTPFPVECHTISPCNNDICGEQCTEVLGFKHPDILCIPANPPSQYYDTCCCRERDNGTRISLSKWWCILFYDENMERWIYLVYL